MFNGRFLVEVVVFNLDAGGGGELTVLGAGLTGSVLGLFVSVVDLVAAGFTILFVVVVVTGVVFFVTSYNCAGFLGYTFEDTVLKEAFFSKLAVFESFLIIDDEE